MIISEWQTQLTPVKTDNTCCSNAEGCGRTLYHLCARPWMMTAIMNYALISILIPGRRQNCVYHVVWTVPAADGVEISSSHAATESDATRATKSVMGAENAKITRFMADI